MEYFNEKTKLFDITEEFPQTIAVFVQNGFPQMDSPEQRERFGRSIDLKTALSLKKKDYHSFAALLKEAIEIDRGNDITLMNKKPAEKGALRIVGLLPCPVRIRLLEEFTAMTDSFSKDCGIALDSELKAASAGLDWIANNLRGIKEAWELPDLFISAGFDIFFDKKLIGQFKEAGVFRDATGIEKFNSDFQDIGLKDPRGHYGIIGVVPAVFLVNKNELGDREIPRTWENLLQPEFEKSVSLPMKDMDLFNGILLNIHKRYGDSGVEKLGRSLLESMHPAQMVKSEKRKLKRPAITIMPWFFTKMVKEGGAMEAVWPEDGAIISPIFILTKKSRIEELQPIVDFFASEKVGKIMSNEGFFPSVLPEIENDIPKGRGFMWLGWDYIEEHDISEVIAHCESLFQDSLSQEVNP